MVVRKLARHQRGGLDDRERRVRLAVDELGAELDRKRETGDVEGVDAAAGALPCFEDADAPAGAGQLARSG